MAYKTLLFKVWSSAHQNTQHLTVCLKCKISGLKKNLHLDKTSIQFLSQILELRSTSLYDICSETFNKSNQRQKGGEEDFTE